MRVSQALCAAGPVDAVTNQGLAFRRLFDSWGWEGSDHAAVIVPGLGAGAMRPLRELDPAADDVLVVHYSGHAAGLERVVGRARRSVLISHNVTPPRYYWADEPLEAARCTLALPQLEELARRVDVLAGVSAYNAEELRDLTGREAEVIPIIFDRARLGQPGVSPSGPPTIVFVGRLTPHKRQDLVIRAFASYRRQAPDARLVLVGVAISPGFEAGLRQLAEELAPGAVTFESGIPSSRLWEHYRAAHVFLCLSEHEGFCIPLLEAFHFGLPVIARDAGAVSEVLGDAGILVGKGDNVEIVSELLPIAVGDDELRAELRARGERRLSEYAYERTAERVRDRLTSLAAA
jgi:glycosyltransferase involved in cell wall biosynthesis